MEEESKNGGREQEWRKRARLEEESKNGGREQEWRKRKGIKRKRMQEENENEYRQKMEKRIRKGRKKIKMKNIILLYRITLERAFFK